MKPTAKTSAIHLQNQCEKLLKVLKEERQDLGNGRLVWNMFMGIGGLLLGMLLVAYFLFKPLVSADFLLSLKAFGSIFCVLAAYVAAKLIDRAFVMEQEVSAYFYTSFLETAKRLPAFMEAVAGHECLTHYHAHKAIARLKFKARCKARWPQRGDQSTSLSQAVREEIEAQWQQRQAFQAAAGRSQTPAMTKDKPEPPTVIE